VTFDVTQVSRPTVFDFWAPTCAECRAMSRDLAEVAAQFTGVVHHERVNPADDPIVARALGVMATPTLVVVADGDVRLRSVGRRSRDEIRQLFEAASGSRDAVTIGRQDQVLRVGAGVALGALGVAMGPAWPLVGIGAAVGAWGIVSRRSVGRG